MALRGSICPYRVLLCGKSFLRAPTTRLPLASGFYTSLHKYGLRFLAQQRLAETLIYSRLLLLFGAHPSVLIYSSAGRVCQGHLLLSCLLRLAFTRITRLWPTPPLSTAFEAEYVRFLAITVPFGMVSVAVGPFRAFRRDCTVSTACIWTLHSRRPGLSNHNTRLAGSERCSRAPATPLLLASGFYTGAHEYGPTIASQGRLEYTSLISWLSLLISALS